MELSEERERNDQEDLKSKTPAPFMSELKKLSPRVSTSNSARFGALSHHSFFSRHNPHPNRVKHISGLNGSPVCIVNDDWYSNTPLFPHPMIRSHVTSSMNHTCITLPSHITYTQADGVKHSSALISDAWREELKELATKVSLSAAGSNNQAGHEIREEPVRRKTQYSSETGRIIPPTSWRTQRRDFQTPQTYPQASQIQPGTNKLEGQELRVLELLCQILQIDSLSLVQQWLLLAGDREKELVRGMLQQAMYDSSALVGQQNFKIMSQNQPPVQTHRKRRMRSVRSAGEVDKEMKEKPDRIGDAEVFRVQHNDTENTDELISQQTH